MKIELPLPVAHLERTLKCFMSLDVKKDRAVYLEIGAHRGRSIGTISNILQNKVKHLHTIGYDIFGSNTSTEFHVMEDNGKGAGNLFKCQRALGKIAKRNPNFTFELIEGYTTNTLKPTKVDWAYIDGGHSYETVKWDHQQLKECDVIVFDDSDLQGVNQYLWEIKDQWEIFDLFCSPGGSRQCAIINNRKDYNFDTAELVPFRGISPEQWKPIR